MPSYLVNNFAIFDHFYSTTTKTLINARLTNIKISLDLLMLPVNSDKISVMPMLFPNRIASRIVYVDPYDFQENKNGDQNRIVISNV